MTETIVSDPEGIWAFLGSGRPRLAGPIGAHRPAVVFTGMRTTGRAEASIGTVPVLNVTRHVIESDFGMVYL